MERNLYFENYINNLQKEIFLLAFDSGYEIITFISYYMKSKVRKEMDKDYSGWHNQPASRILEEVLSESGFFQKNNKQTINRDAVEWLGFFYSKWHFLTGESSKTIVRFLKPSNGLKNYYVLHQLAEEEAIEKCKRLYNLSRNKHRNNENKNSEESKQRYYKEPIYYSFLAVRMLYKLKKDKVYDQLSYVGDSNDVYDFINGSYSLGVKGDVLFTNNSGVLDNYLAIEKTANKCLRRTETSIYFCFVFSPYYEIDDNNGEKLLLHIHDLKQKYPPHLRNYNYLFFYLLGKLYEVTPSNEIFIYSLPFSKRERMGIVNKMKKLGL